ncbi:Molybdopterin biosynthesis protein MogA [Acidilobus saccharovorans 345-15]|uniref:Molybdopterin biosynthesis protein MogA n=1 Tax=Acidilobus saccharovorans (strain DSM 16705 / JCM 18335 / VKM B-2471 / 345-15) TaxID=666510 RepID=D9Q262_ACIS3|nr:molybdenum cofactor biosynthesis protein B [Acidilobus saccharovorans]ADL19400.1 Molybdopterin biosynthesis protein MogA [Acidilobus saccharovorans 345-15]
MVNFSLVVTSDHVYRGEKADEVTPLVKERLAKEGHQLIYSVVVPNNPDIIKSAVLDAASRADVVLVSGGTGPSPRDISYDVVKELASKELPGFGELFRFKSLESVGSGVILTRASAFVLGRSLVVVVPGSPSAMGIALEILMPIVNHAVEQIHGEPHH